MKNTPPDVLRIQGSSANAQVVFDGHTMRSTGTLPRNGVFIICVVGELTEDRSERLANVCRGVLSSRPITSIVDGGGLSFDLPQWLRDHKKEL